MCYNNIIKEPGQTTGQAGRPGPVSISEERMGGMAERKKRLTDKDKRFADEYAIDFDAKAAAIRAGYSETTARNAAAWIHEEHPEKPELRALIDQKLARMSRRSGVTAERLIHELALVAFANINDIVDPDTGELLNDISREDAAAVSEVRVSRKGSEVRMHDKLRAIELLGKRLNLFDEKITLRGDKDAPPVINFINEDKL